MEFRKIVTNDPICETAKETQIFSVGEGEGGMI